MKDYLHNTDILWDKTRKHNHRLLPYPTHDLTIGKYTCQVYEIPEEAMQADRISLNRNKLGYLFIFLAFQY